MEKDSNNKKSILPLEKYIEEAKNTDKIISEYKEKAIREAYKEVQKYKEYVGADNIDDNINIEYVTEDGISVIYHKLDGKEKIDIDLDQLSKYAEDINKKYGNKYVIKVNIKNSKVKKPVKDLDIDKIDRWTMEKSKIGIKTNGIKLITYAFFKVLYIFSIFAGLYNICFGIFNGKMNYILYNTLNIYKVDNLFTKVSLLVTILSFSIINIVVLKIICEYLEISNIKNGIDIKTKSKSTLLSPIFIFKLYFVTIDYLYSLFKLCNKSNKIDYINEITHNKLVGLNIDNNKINQISIDIYKGDYNKEFMEFVKFDLFYYILITVTSVIYFNLMLLDNSSIKIVLSVMITIIVILKLISVSRIHYIVNEFKEKLEV